LLFYSYKLGCLEAGGKDCEKKAIAHGGQMEKILKKELFK
jgi:hypothetical protein